MAKKKEKKNKKSRKVDIFKSVSAERRYWRWKDGGAPTAWTQTANRKLHNPSHRILFLGTKFISRTCNAQKRLPKDAVSSINWWTILARSRSDACQNTRRRGKKKVITCAPFCFWPLTAIVCRPHHGRRGLWQGGRGLLAQLWPAGTSQVFFHELFRIFSASGNWTTRVRRNTNASKSSEAFYFGSLHLSAKSLRCVPFDKRVPQRSEFMRLSRLASTIVTWLLSGQPRVSN